MARRSRRAASHCGRAAAPRAEVEGLHLGRRGRTPLDEAGRRAVRPGVVAGGVERSTRAALLAAALLAGGPRPQRARRRVHHLRRAASRTAERQRRWRCARRRFVRRTAGAHPGGHAAASGRAAPAAGAGASVQCCRAAATTGDSTARRAPERVRDHGAAVVMPPGWPADSVAPGCRCSNRDWPPADTASRQIAHACRGGSSGEGVRSSGFLPVLLIQV